MLQKVLKGVAWARVCALYAPHRRTAALLTQRVWPSPDADVGRGEPSPGADVGRGEPSPGADVTGRRRVCTSRRAFKWERQVR